MNTIWTKASAIVLLTTSLVLGGTYVPAQAASSSCTVTLTNVKMISNEHVGNEWYTEAKAGGKRLSEGQSVTVQTGSNGKVSLYAYVEEQDKIPDQGSATKSVKVSSISTRGTSVTMQVTITENRGRYSGNEAVWEFTYKLKK